MKFLACVLKVHFVYVAFVPMLLWYSLVPFWMGKIFLHDEKYFSMEHPTKGYNLPIYLFFCSKIQISIESILW
jgi:hypothetical protein